MRQHQSRDWHGRAAMLVLLACVAYAADSCDSQRLVAECTGIPSRAIVVAVRDSTTGAAAADGAFGTVESAGRVDTLTQSDSLLMFGGTRLGTYSVVIEHAGYDAWTTSGVNVTQLGSCGNVLPVQLTASLQPSMP